MAIFVRNLAVPALVLLSLTLAGCQVAPVRSAPPPPSPAVPAPGPGTAVTPAVVVATVTAMPQGKTRVTYRIAFTVPKGVDSISVVLPDLAPPLPSPAAAEQGEAKECSGGFFSCSKLVAETVSAVIAAIVALLGLLKLLRGRRKGKR